MDIPSCEGIVETLMRHNLFPSTPRNPHVAFTFDLLDLYTQLLLQAHVPYLSFCRVLDALHSSQNIDKVSSICSIIFILIFNILNNTF